MKHSTVSLARKVKFYQLVVFDQIVASGSLVKAAGALNITQPSLTKIVQELEYFFQAPLLVRGNRGVTATELGELISRRARSMLADLRALNDDVEAYRRGTSGYMLVGSLTSASMSAIPQALHLVRQRAPSLLISLRVGQMNQLLSVLQVGELDMVVGRIPDDWGWRANVGDLTVVPLYQERLSVVAGAKHPLHALETRPWDLMHAYPWILPPRESVFRNCAENVFAKAGMTPPTDFIESASILTNIALMQDNQTLSLLPAAVAGHFVQSGMIKEVDVGEDLAYGQVGCFFAAHRKREPSLSLLLECLKKVTQAVEREDAPFPTAASLSLMNH
ncbi:HTH-type transcriptional regulator GbpR [compost metagenome]|uniref:LysR substrate-binding domain-containing protein n=1 Tax=Achromobacter sp. Root83 TaxID=1736602 RepID=UPI00070D836F|nr:LysR substrate-binding domain-containing protein [Achromobacter sp. Root83]KRC80545.1 LysR family transcriptional regulator [Achromobacter sp. Root83]